MLPPPCLTAGMVCIASDCKTEHFVGGSKSHILILQMFAVSPMHTVKQYFYDILEKIE